MTDFFKDIKSKVNQIGREGFQRVASSLNEFVTVMNESATSLRSSLFDDSVGSNSEAIIMGAEDDQRRISAALWDCTPDQNRTKELISALFEDESTFTTEAPLSFQFELDNNYQLADRFLKESPQLSLQRFNLVPRRLSEEAFWRNLFYRISLLTRSSDSINANDVSADTTNEIRSVDITRDDYDTIDEELNYLMSTNVDEDDQNIKK
ncbi:hypothetical protein ACOME3_009802 [Neoechinorhynchus agilis]